MQQTQRICWNSIGIRAAKYSVLGLIGGSISGVSQIQSFDSMGTRSRKLFVNGMYGMGIGFLCVAAGIVVPVTSFYVTSQVISSGKHPEKSE